MNNFFRITSYLVGASLVMLYMCLWSPVASATTVATGNLTARECGEPFDAMQFWRSFKSRYATVNGIRLHYVIGGHGDPVLLLHGYPETWYDWRKVMPELAQHYTVIAPDMRGLGDSSIPADGDYRMKSVSDDLYKLVNHLGMQRLFIAGQDLGGPVAVDYCALHPKDVRALVFIDSGIPGYGLEQLMDTSRGGSWHFGFFAAPLFPEMLTRGREREFLTAFAYQGRFVYQRAAFDDADITEYIRHYTKPGGMTAGFGYYRAMAQDAVDNHVLIGSSKLDTPVLAVGGAHSFGPFGEKNLKMLDSHVTAVIVPDCGHFVNEEQPKALCAAMILFFKGK